MAKLDPEVLTRAAFVQASEESTSYEEAAKRLGIADQYLRQSIQARRRPFSAAAWWVLASAAWLYVGYSSNNIELIWWSLATYAVAPFAASRLPIAKAGQMFLLSGSAMFATSLVHSRFGVGQLFSFPWAVLGVILPVALMLFFGSRHWRESFQ